MDSAVEFYLNELNQQNVAPEERTCSNELVGGIASPKKKAADYEGIKLGCFESNINWAPRKLRTGQLQEKAEMAVPHAISQEAIL